MEGRETVSQDAISAKPMLHSLTGGIAARPPVWLMRQAGRYLPEYRKIRAQVPSFLELCYTPELAVEVTLQPIRRYKLDAAILFSDILVVPDALGQSVAFREGEGPVLAPIRSDADVARLRPDGIHERLAPVYETVRRLAAALPREVALIGFAFARDMLQKRGAVQGNLDPLLLVSGGAAMTAAIRAILDALTAGPFVFNLGHGIVPETPPEHVAELVALLHGV